MRSTQPQPCNADESAGETATESVSKTPSLELKKRLDARLLTLKTLLKHRRERENIMMKTELPELLRGKNGPDSTENGPERLNESGMPEESLDFLPPTDESLTEHLNNLGPDDDTSAPPLEPPEPSTNNTSPTSEIIVSQSMSLLDESANHMFDLMKGLHGNQPPASVKAYDPERVNSAVACANTIYKIMRLKLDAIKVQRKLK